MSTSKTIYILDRLVHKPVKITWASEVISPKTYIIYKNQEWKEMLWTVLWYPTRTDKSWTFISLLNKHEKQAFETGKEKAAELFWLFKEAFTKEFSTAVPITARMNLHNNQIYFYFFADTRFNFASFVKSFRAKIGMHFFIYQVDARDRVRLHPHLHERYDPCGLPLMYHIFKHRLDNVDKETFEVQQLWWRNQQRMKDRSGRLDHSINFEKDFYLSERKKYPQKGKIVQRMWKPMKCIGYNMLTQEIKLRGKTPEEKKKWKHKKEKVSWTTWFGDFVKIHLDEYLWKRETKNNTNKKSWK